MTPPADQDRHEYREAGTRALLDVFAAGNPDEQLRMGDVLHGLGDRSFGMLLFVSTIVCVSFVNYVVRPARRFLKVGQNCRA